MSSPILFAMTAIVALGLGTLPSTIGHAQGGPIMKGAGGRVMATDTAAHAPGNPLMMSERLATTILPTNGGDQGIAWVSGKGGIRGYSSPGAPSPSLKSR
jgi:hypothetical protein